MTSIVLIAHNIRSCHNVGSLFRTGDGLGICRLYLTGYTPYPLQPDDQRLPHLSRKLDHQIAKTALGAEKSVAWTYSQSIFIVIDKLRADGYQIVALEQAPHSIPLQDFRPTSKTCLIVGREVAGLEPEVLQCCDTIVEIPMRGQKESFNVAVAAAIGLYHMSVASNY